MTKHGFTKSQLSRWKRWLDKHCVMCGRLLTPVSIDLMKCPGCDARLDELTDKNLHKHIATAWLQGVGPHDRRGSALHQAVRKIVGLVDVWGERELPSWMINPLDTLRRALEEDGG